MINNIEESFKIRKKGEELPKKKFKKIKRILKENPLIFPIIDFFEIEKSALIKYGHKVDLKGKKHCENGKYYDHLPIIFDEIFYKRICFSLDSDKELINYYLNIFEETKMVKFLFNNDKNEKIYSIGYFKKINNKKVGFLFLE